MSKKITVYDELASLVDQFTVNLDQYKSAGYKEASVRVDFIDRFFEMIGWDVRNLAGKAEQYRDVIREDSVEIEGHQKAPDYSFRVGGVRKFFVEAKKPSVNLHDDIAPSLQVRRYSFSAKLSLGVLTDFEEFAIYDTRIKPGKADKTSTARVFYCKFTDYLQPCSYEGKEFATTFDFIRSILAKESIESGSFDNWAAANTKRGSGEVDREFLALMSIWREDLAKNIAARNLAITVRDLNLAVQRLIDRLVFLRFAEDRGAERDRMLYEAATTKGTYAALADVFEAARIKYNSDLFEKNALIAGLAIDDKVLTDIIKSMYFPDCPYEFSVMPLEILGSAYEQFLGKSVRIEGGDKRHRAIVEEKPEVRKAGGVYYTPQYIVEYIVKETVGAKLAGTTPDTAALTIVDPACGSGSFLIGAYDFLLKWYLGAYTADATTIKTALKARHIVERDRGEYRLTLGEKRRILTDSIHGVDIDQQAVEVTKLSLYLKLLEGEGMTGGQAQLALAHEKLLPSLNENIKCGNSLIGPDYYDDKDLGLFPDEELARINVFDWKKSFPNVFAHGGFDCVIGNPPYVRMESFIPLKEYLKQCYKSHDERADLYNYFIEKGIHLLKTDGYCSMIVSNKFLKAKYGKNCRSVMADNACLKTLINFEGARIFKDATVRTCIFVITKNNVSDYLTQYCPAPNYHDLRIFESISDGIVRFVNTQSYSIKLSGSDWLFVNNDEQIVLARMQNVSIPLSDYIHGTALFGIKTGFNEAFIIDELTKNCISDNSSNEVILPIYFGRDLKRYTKVNAGRWIIYLHPNKDIEKYPKILAYLSTYKKKLEERATQQKWYELQQPSIALLRFRTEPKIIYPIIANNCRFSLDTDGCLVNDKSFILPSGDPCLLAILNSKISNFWFYHNCAALEGEKDKYLEFRAQFVNRYPVPKLVLDNIDFKNKIKTLSAQIIDCHQKIEVAEGSDKNGIKTRIEAMDRQIDQLVYKLYGLTDDEIKIVECG